MKQERVYLLVFFNFSCINNSGKNDYTPAIRHIYSLIFVTQIKELMYRYALLHLFYSTMMLQCLLFLYSTNSPRDHTFSGRNSCLRKALNQLLPLQPDLLDTSRFRARICCKDRLQLLGWKSKDNSIHYFFFAFSYLSKTKLFNDAVTLEHRFFLF